jgi:glycosyltransferase involved in cell wall biosynthesis
MKFGCVPIVYNSYPAASEIIQDGYNGFLVEPFNKKKYIQKLLLLMNNRDLRLEMAENAKKSALWYEPSNIAPLWMALFNNTSKK